MKVDDVYELTLWMPKGELAERLGCKIQELDDHADEKLWALIRDHGEVVSCEEKVAATLEP